MKIYLSSKYGWFQFWNRPLSWFKVPTKIIFTFVFIGYRFKRFSSFLMYLFKTLSLQRRRQRKAQRNYFCLHGQHFLLKVSVNMCSGCFLSIIHITKIKFDLIKGISIHLSAQEVNNVGLFRNGLITGSFGAFPVFLFLSILGCHTQLLRQTSTATDPERREGGNPERRREIVKEDDES